MATLTISIDRASLSLAPLVFSASYDGIIWGILPGFQMPGRIARNRYASSPWVHGDVNLGSTWQQALLAFDAAPEVESPTALQAAVEELYAALGQFSYETTVNQNGVSTVWACDTGSAQPAAIDLMEIEHNRPTYSLSIPCYPVGA